MSSRAATQRAFAVGTAMLVACTLVAAAPPAGAAGSITLTTPNGARATITINDATIPSTGCSEVPINVSFSLPELGSALISIDGSRPGSSDFQVVETFLVSRQSGTERGSFLACTAGSYAIKAFLNFNSSFATSGLIFVRVTEAPPPPSATPTPRPTPTPEPTSSPTPTPIPTITPAATRVCFTEGRSQRCAPGMTWTSVRCWASKRVIAVKDELGTPVLRARPKRSAACPKSRPFRTRVSMTEAGPDPFAYIIGTSKQSYSVVGRVEII